MPSDFINNEVDKVFMDKEYVYPRNLAMSCAWILGNHKGLNLKVVHVENKSSITDYFVLASATNQTQIQAMAQEILFQSKRLNYPYRSKEGLESSEWILLDLNDVIVHIFLENSREFYDLDGLWENDPVVEIPQSFYSSSDSFNESSQQINTDKQYF